MHTKTKTTLAAIAATLILTLALTSNATARNFELTEKEFEMLFRPLEFEAAGNIIRCPMTLLGRFIERTLPKIVGTQVGAIRHVEPTTGAEPSPCTGGTITILNETLPWLIYYQGFQGRLPEISRIRYSLVRISFRLTPRGSATCLAGTTAREPAFAEQRIGAGGRVESIRLDETRTIRLGGGFLCELAGESRFIGEGTILNLPQSRSIFVFLI